MKAATPSHPRIGLVGAGLWATHACATSLAASPRFVFAGVHSARRDSAARLADRYDTGLFDSFPAMLGECDVVMFAVPPHVQSALACEAARHGKHVLLAKPLAESLDSAERLADAIDRASVASALVLPFRHVPTLTELALRDWNRARGGRLSIQWRDDRSDGWRAEAGVLLDFGPHAFDVLELTLGPIEWIQALGDVSSQVWLQCEHQDGPVSQAVLSNRPGRHTARLELFTSEEPKQVDLAETSDTGAVTEILESFAELISGGQSVLPTARHGLHLQELIERSMHALAEVGCRK
jgi:predicted dehydrogenase